MQLDQLPQEQQVDGLASMLQTLSEHRHRQPLHSTVPSTSFQHSKRDMLAASGRQDEKDCSSLRLAAPASLQSCPSWSMASSTATSKASRYLQRHVFSTPPALQQMQAHAQHGSRGSDTGFARGSLADSCSSMAGMSDVAVRQLQFALGPEALSGQVGRTAAAADVVEQMDSQQVHHSVIV